MSNKLRVAFIEPVGGHGGNDFYDFGLCKAINDAGVDVFFYTTNETALQNQFNFNFETVLSYKNIYGKTPAVIRGIRYLLSTIRTVYHARKVGCVIAHFHLYHFSNREFFNFLVFKFFGFKIVSTIHDVEDFQKFGKAINPKKYLRFQKRTDAVIIHSEFAKKQIMDYYQGFPLEKFFLIPHGDSDFLYKPSGNKNESRKKLNLPESEKIILFFGQIKKVKGLDVLLNAFSKVRLKLSGVKLLIVGSPWKLDEDEIHSLIQKNNMQQDCIMRIGYCPNADVPDYFNAADLVVLPYRKIYSSGVMIRALDYRSAIIASDQETFRNIIESGSNGILFRNEDDNDLAEKIISVINDDQKLYQMKTEAKKTADEKFGWKMIGNKMKEAYESVE